MSQPSYSVPDNRTRLTRHFSYRWGGILLLLLLIVLASYWIPLYPDIPGQVSGSPAKVIIGLLTRQNDPTLYNPLRRKPSVVSTVVVIIMSLSISMVMVIVMVLFSFQRLYRPLLVLTLMNAVLSGWVLFNLDIHQVHGSLALAFACSSMAFITTLSKY
jgi:hypothetical protein